MGGGGGVLMKVNKKFHSNFILRDLKHFKTIFSHLREWVVGKIPLMFICLFLIPFLIV